LVRKLGLVVALLVLVAAGCKVDGSVTVAVKPDGSGVVAARVRLDAEAVAAAETGGAKLEDAVRLGDLTAAGWHSSGWVRAKNGTATLTLTKGFARAEYAGSVVAELNGADGPLRDVKVTRTSSTFTQKWAFSGIADLKDMKTGIATDADLVARLTAQRVNVAALDLRLLAQTQQALRLHVTADLPHASPKLFPTPPGSSSALHTSSSETAMNRILLLVLGISLGVIAIVLVAAGELRARRRRRVAGA
jgi:hypothetical protein